MRRGMVPRAWLSAAAERPVVRRAEVVEHLGEDRDGPVVVELLGGRQRILGLRLLRRLGLLDGWRGFGDRRLLASEQSCPEALLAVRDRRGRVRLDRHWLLDDLFLDD